jgi:hypothetical protein
MAIYSLALRTTDVTITQAAWELRTAGNRCRLLELGMTATAATAQTLGLGRPQAQGITPVNVLFQAEDFAEVASVSNASLSWGTSPTVPLQFYRRLSLPATIGAGMIWTFPRSLWVPINASLVLWNITSGAALDIWAVIEE